MSMTLSNLMSAKLLLYILSYDILYIIIQSKRLAQ